MRKFNWMHGAALATSLVVMGGAFAQAPNGVRGELSVERDEKVTAAVMRPGVGSFASYLTQATGSTSTSAQPPLAAPQPAFVLRKGERLDLQLQAWAHAAQWELLWLPDESWKVVGDSSFSGMTDVTAAISEVISVIREEGKQVRLSIADGNRIMEVHSTNIVSNRETVDE